jgi:Fe-S-cluster containining protein
MLPGLPVGTAKVACGSCRKCCRSNSFIVLQDGENPASYDCYEFQPGMFALKRAPNGDCIYLGPNGCTIWGRHPVICKVFDCALFVKAMDRGAFDDMGPRVENDIVAEGRRRIAKPAANT